MSTPPSPPPLSGTKPDYQQVGCGYILAFYGGLFAVLTPLIMVGWNVGLENAGIVGNEITWTTALGLAVCLMLLRGLLASRNRV